MNNIEYNKNMYHYKEFDKLYLIPLHFIHYRPDSHMRPHFNNESSWNVMAHGDAREGKRRGNWRMEWVASTLHTTPEHGVSSITTADTHISAASSRLNWRPPADLNGLVPFRKKDEIWLLRVCHHISKAVYCYIVF